MNIWIGIDPGKGGSACFLREDGSLIFVDWPKTNLCRDLYVPFRTLLCGNTVVKAGLEKVHSMPSQGVKSMFSFGQNYGRWEMLLGVLQVPYLDPTPQQWQKNLVRKSDAPDAKQRSYLAACRLYPKHMDMLKGSKGGIKDGRCDALLIAHYVRGLK